MKHEKLAGFVTSILTLISPKLNTKVVYFYKNKKRINLKNPKEFHEKLLWLKLYIYNDNPYVKECADKYRVREYVKKKCGGGQILNELYFVYDKPEQIEWDKLPEQFVIKLNVGSGYNIICTDKSKLNKADVISQIDNWDYKKYWLAHAEIQYKDVPRKILVEKYMIGKSGGIPEDYKIFCFNGKVRAILYITGRFTAEMAEGFFDENWNYIGEAWLRGKQYANAFDTEFLPPRPQSLIEMVHVAEVLSKDFPFVRVDMYDIDGKAVFGEMTFTPMAGFDLQEHDLDGKNMGEYIQLPAKEKVGKCYGF